MTSTLVVIGLVSLATFVACSAAAPAGQRSHRRAAARRRRHIEQNPTHVGSQDIHAQLVRDGIAPSQARLILEKASEHGIKPFTMWLWLQQFDAEVLGIVIAADVSHRDLLTHISNGTVPDLAELTLFASANGLVVAGPPVDRPRRKVLVDSTERARRRKPLPPIHEPGTWPGAPSTGPASRKAARKVAKLGKNGLAA